jgi:hypothetical protein
MKIRNFLNLFLFLAIGVLTFTSCEDDGTGTGTETGPSISFGIGSGEDLAINTGEIFTVRVTAEKGTNEMNSLSIFEDGALVSFDRLTINGTAAAANAILLVGADRTSLTWDIDIMAQSDESTNVYTIEVNDQTNTRSVSLNVTTTDPRIPIDTPLMGVLMNKSGPTGTGGLDLDEGLGTGSASTLAEIRDEGNVSMTSQDWKKQVAGVNSSEMKYIIPNQNGVPEGFTFGSVEYKDEILSLYGNGVDFTATNSDGDLVSNVVTTGDLFIVKNADNYYLLEVAEISETGGDNADFYSINIKK